MSSREQESDNGCDHPILKDMLGTPERPEGPERLVEDYEENLELERNFVAMGVIRDYFTQPDLEPMDRALAPLYQPIHAVDSIGNQFGKLLLPAFLEDDPELALDKFRDIQATTTAQEMVLLANDEQFEDLRLKVHQEIEEKQAEMMETVGHRLSPDGPFSVADHNQFNDAVQRSLEIMNFHGVDIRINPEAAEVVRAAAEMAGEGIVPITELLKNERILEVNGFTQAKISHAVHDTMDHLWLFDLLRRNGTLDKYHVMFDSIGNPESTDMFKREGEAVASIGFGVRYFQTMESGFRPLIDAKDIRKLMEEMYCDQELDETRHSEALRIILSLSPGSREWQSLGFTFSNYITELDEQRRKHGKIKQRDIRTRSLQGELDPLSPDYLSFFIEAHHAVTSSQNKHRNALFRFHILLEEYLSGVAKGSIPTTEPIIIRPQRLHEYDAKATTLPPQRLSWMNQNYGFTATRGDVI